MKKLQKKEIYASLSPRDLSLATNHDFLIDSLEGYIVVACEHVNFKHLQVVKKVERNTKTKIVVEINPQNIEDIMSIDTDIEKPIILLTRDPEFYVKNNKIDPYALIKSKYPFAQNVIVETVDSLTTLMPIAMREAKINFECFFKKFLPYLNGDGKEYVTDIYWRVGLYHYIAVYIYGDVSYTFTINDGDPILQKIYPEDIVDFVNNNEKPCLIYEEKIECEIPYQTVAASIWRKQPNVYELSETEVPILLLEKNEVYCGQGINQALVGCLNHEYVYGVESDYGNKTSLTKVKKITPQLENQELEDAIVQSMKCPWLSKYTPGKGSLEFRSLPSPFAYLRRFHRMQ